MARAGKRSRCALSVFVACILALTIPASSQGAESLDPSFGEGGISFPGIGGAGLYDLTQAPNRTLVGSGGSPFGFLVSRLLPNGALDLTFGGGEGVVTNDFGFYAQANAVALQPGGKILLAGGSGPGNFVLARYTRDGSRDLGFQRGGRTRRNVGRGGGALDLAVLPSGRILAAGYGVRRDEQWRAVVIAYRPNGTIDRSFSSNGVASITAGEAEIKATAMAVLPDGRIVLVGDVNGRVMVLRLLSNGDLDKSFGGGDGQVYADVDGSGRCACSFGEALALDRRGQILVAANVVAGNPEPTALIRFKADGTLDRGFGNGGVVRTTLGSRLAVQDIALQRNGRIVSVGTYNVPGNGEARVAVLRHLPDGTLDRGFGRRGFFTRDFGVEGVAYAALTQRDGRVVVAGRANPKPSPFKENPSVYDTAQVFLMRFLP